MGLAPMAAEVERHRAVVTGKTGMENRSGGIIQGPMPLQAPMNSSHSPQPVSGSLSLLRLWRPILAMMVVVVASNFLVQYPINAWLTWGAFVYPVAFLVTDLTNRAVGVDAAKRVAWTGFAIAVLVSLLLAPWRIALASGVAFIVSQLADVRVFDRWRVQTWWKAPLIGSLVASVIDTLLFFSLAFAGSGMEWWLLAIGDLGIKWLMAVLLLGPYRALLPYLGGWVPQQRAY
jgi:uncharacterized PurR-regulated membrane protein YhhQ (DUF165 family)